jgi:hypothetical protein
LTATVSDFWASDSSATPGKTNVRIGSSTDLTAPKSDFRFTPESGLKSDIGPCPFRAKFGSSRLIRSLRRRRPEASSVRRQITILRIFKLFEIHPASRRHHGRDTDDTGAGSTSRSA